MSDVDLQGQINNAFDKGFIRTKSGLEISLRLAWNTILALEGLITEKNYKALSELLGAADGSVVSEPTKQALSNGMCSQILTSDGRMLRGTKQIIDDVLRLNLVNSSGDAYRLDTEHYFAEFKRVAPQGTKVAPSLLCSTLPIFVPQI